MASRQYENFDLLIEEEHGGYQARVTACPSNETPAARFTFPLDETRLENLLLKLDPGRSDMRGGSGDPRETASRELGAALYSAAFSGDVHEAWIRSQEHVRAREHGLRLRLKLTDAPVLAGLPWELLYNARLNQYPAQSEATPVIRFLGDRGSGALRVDGPLTILFVLASPTDLPELDLENEWRAVNEELAPLVARGLVRLERLPQPATPGRLLERLSDSPVHIVHFVGHGDFAESTQEGVVYFCTNYSTKNPIGADRLGSVLQDVHDLKLVVLNACHSARGDAHDVFGGMAQGLVRNSVSAVAAMQFPVSDRAASTFSRALYRAIARGYPVDQAMAGARKSLLMDFPREWATPVLYLRSDDGVLFELPVLDGPRTAPPDPGRPPQPRPPQPGLSQPGPTRPPARTPSPPRQRGKLTWALIGLMIAASVGWFVFAIWKSFTPDPPPGSGTTLKGPAITAAHLSTPPTIDGRDDDWPRIPTVTTDKLVLGAAATTSSTWELGWDDNALYFFVTVSGSQLGPDQADANRILANTGVSFDLGTATPSHDNLSLEPEDVMLIATPLQKTNQSVTQILGANPAGSAFGTALSIVGVNVFGTGTGSGYTIEGRIPWSALSRSAAADYTQMGMNLYARQAGDKAGAGLLDVVSNNPAATLSGSLGSWRDHWSTLTLVP